MIQCPNCKLKLNPPTKIRPPLHCACGAVIEIPEGYEQTAKTKPPKKPVCMHRGKHRGHASCKCGSVYECGLYGGVCTPRKPPDNLATLVIDGKPVEIIDLEIPFHACAGCEGFAVELHE